MRAGIAGSDAPSNNGGKGDALNFHYHHNPIKRINPVQVMNMTPPSQPIVPILDGTER